MDAAEPQVSSDSVIPFPPTAQTAHAQEGARRNEHLLHTVLDNMEQGVLMFDAGARLVFCNRHYLKMYGLSRTLAVPGCSLRDLLRHRTQIGNFSGRPRRLCRQVDGLPRRGEDVLQCRQLGRRSRGFDRQHADRRRRMARHPRRHHRPAEGPGADRAHGAARRADRPSQSRLVARAAGAGVEARETRRVPGHAVPRPRPLQERQRHARASGRRRAAAGRRRPAARLRGARPTRCPARRRRVRDRAGRRRAAARRHHAGSSASSRRSARPSTSTATR